jgi:hypothetical protein
MGLMVSVSNPASSGARRRGAHRTLVHTTAPVAKANVFFGESRPIPTGDRTRLSREGRRTHRSLWQVF